MRRLDPPRPERLGQARKRRRDCGQTAANNGGVRWAVSGILGEQLADQLAQVRWSVGGQLGQVGRLIEVSSDDLGVGAGEGRLAGQALVEDAAQGIEVGARCRLAVPNLCRRVGEGQEHGATDRRAGVVDDAGDVEVSQLDRAVRAE